MEMIDPAIFAVGAVNFLAFLFLLWFIKQNLEKFDNKREETRIERANTERKVMSRTILLNNYEKCVDKSYYTLDILIDIY